MTCQTITTLFTKKHRAALINTHFPFKIILLFFYNWRKPCMLNDQHDGETPTTLFCLFSFPDSSSE